MVVASNTIFACASVQQCPLSVVRRDTQSRASRSTTTRTSSGAVSNAPTTPGRRSRRRASVRFSPRADRRSTKDSSRHRGFTFAGGRRSAPNAAPTVRATSACLMGSSADCPRSGTLARPPLRQRAGQRTLRTPSLRSCSRLVQASRRSRQRPIRGHSPWTCNRV